MTDLVLAMSADSFEALVAAVAAALPATNAKERWPEWLDVEHAAAYLDVSVQRIRKLQATKSIPYYQESPNCRVFFRRQELNEWMNGFRVGPRAQR